MVFSFAATLRPPRGGQVTVRCMTQREDSYLSLGVDNRERWLCVTPDGGGVYLMGYCCWTVGGRHFHFLPRSPGAHPPPFVWCSRSGITALVERSCDVFKRVLFRREPQFGNTGLSIIDKGTQRRRLADGLTGVKGKGKGCGLRDGKQGLSQFGFAWRFLGCVAGWGACTTLGGSPNLWNFCPASCCPRESAGRSAICDD